VTIFDFINDILFSKKGDKAENEDDELQFNGYLVNRWISMYSPSMAVIINNTTNWLYPIFETKKDYYNFLLKIVPKVNKKYIRYIKKIKDDNTHKDTGIDNEVDLLAANLEISKREIQSYIELTK
tara:strand:+ start:373 stop:747 length:375 start_codon:yes stop_codon:yes gene_type:complete